mgnify:CR=1 FL=1|tara:strand:+ start:235 stop:531 length:297 start_codon:yes stop_codon:yes gene_type:complete
MNKNDLNKLVRWSVDSDLKQFGEDAYGVTGTAYEIAMGGDYLRGKFKQMQNNFIMWLGGLDSKNRERLARNITFRKTEEVDEHYEDIYSVKLSNTKGE